MPGTDSRFSAARRRTAGPDCCAVIDERGVRNLGFALYWAGWCAALPLWVAQQRMLVVVTFAPSTPGFMP
jgi:hypothetical protein